MKSALEFPGRMKNDLPDTIKWQVPRMAEPSSGPELCQKPIRGIYDLAPAGLNLAPEGPWGVPDFLNLTKYPLNRGRLEGEWCFESPFSRIPVPHIGGCVRVAVSPNCG